MNERPLWTLRGVLFAALWQITVCQDLVSNCAGGFHTCSIFVGGLVKCWGSNEFGQLGLGDTLNRGNTSMTLGNSLPFVDLGEGRVAMDIDCSLTHTCALLDDGNLKCWGSNEFGQLGLGDTANRGDGNNEMGDSLPRVNLGAGMRVVSFATGQFHTCALLNDGNIKCWGNNGFGQLGLGDTVDRGEDSTSMGDELPPVPLGSGRSAVIVQCGAWHSCVVLDTGHVKCWGGNHHGQLGQGDIAHRGSASGELGDSLPTIALGTNRSATSLSCGYWHTCSLLDDGSAKCWGYNGDWQLGIQEFFRKGDEPGEMGDALPAINFGIGRSVTNLTCGSRHTCALFDDFTTKCWGYNFYGMLGYGDILQRGGDSGLLPDSIPAVDLGAGRATVALSLGYWHSCALLADGTAKCWGFNDRGQLGVGDVRTRGNVGGQMGDNLPVVIVGCRIGWRLIDTAIQADRDKACRDIDECALQQDDCTAQSMCSNTAGSFQCLCNPGYAQTPQPVGICPGCLPISEICVACPPQQYKPLFGIGDCLACPASSIANRPASAACACSPGFFNYSAAQGCMVCVSGFFCPGGDSIIRCPNASSSEPGSASDDDCDCDKGYRKDRKDGVLFCVVANSNVAVIVGASVAAALVFCFVLAFLLYRSRPRPKVEPTEEELEKEAEEGRKKLAAEKERLQKEEEAAKKRDEEIKEIRTMESNDEANLTLCEHNRARQFCSECRGSRKYTSGAAVLSRGRVESADGEVLFKNVGSSRSLKVRSTREEQARADARLEEREAEEPQTKSRSLRELTAWSRSRKEMKEDEEKTQGSARALKEGRGGSERQLSMAGTGSRRKLEGGGRG